MVADIVIGYVPNGVLEPVVILSDDVPALNSVEGLNEAVVPAGKPDALRVTPPLNPAATLTETTCPELPVGPTDCCVGVAVIKKVEFDTNVALTFLAALMVTRADVPANESTPLHDWNVYPDAGDAVSCTCVPAVYVPPGGLTVPAPGGLTDVVS